MIINTAPTNHPLPRPGTLRLTRPRNAGLLLAAFLALGESAPLRAGTVIGPWVPIFKGIDHAVGTNTPSGGGMPNQNVVHALRVDLTDPTIRFFPSPRCSGYIADGSGNCGLETAAYTTTNFLRLNRLQVAINANNFHDQCTADSPSYTIPEGTRVRVTGELVCTGQVVSVQEAAVDDSTFRFTSNNQPTFIPTNWPTSSTAGVNVSVTGLYAILVNGVNIGSNYVGLPLPHDAEPRTLFGLSADSHYLYMMTVDGRQPGYSNGCLDWEAARWLQLLGAWNGANMDGGGSTCMVMQDSTGKPIELNRDSASAANGRERTVGCQLGIFAQPLPGIINNVAAQPDDVAATVTWNTVLAGSSQVRYGTTPSFGSSTPVFSNPVTNHAVLLTNLSPFTGYYYQVLTTVSGSQYASSNFYFLTTNYVNTNFLFDVTNEWMYTTDNLNGSNWTAVAYDDSTWLGPSPGLLWADIRGPNANIPAPLITEMPYDPGTGYPYVTYYFRTHFNSPTTRSGSSLLLSNYIDDGAVFYLNGTELIRIRMPDYPNVIFNSTLATDAPCTSDPNDPGDAVCDDTFTVLVPNLLAGDNVLAVQVHNFSAGSPDVTFGCALSTIVPYTLPVQLSIALSNGVTTVSWPRGGFTLQQATSVTGPWTDVPGPVVSSPYAVSSPGTLFYRLRR